MYNSILIHYFTLLFGFTFAQNVPVVLWGEPTLLKPTFQTISKDTFRTIIVPHLKNSMILVFSEKRLDFMKLSMCKTQSKETCLNYFQSFGLKNYYANVELPIDALKDITDKEQFVNLDKNGNFNESINYEIGKIVFVKLDDSIKDTSESLSKHGSDINQIYNKLLNSGRILSIYTTESKLSRKVRQTNPVKNIVLKEPGKFLLSYKKLTLIEDQKNPVEITLTDLSLVSANKSDTIYKLIGSQSIEFVVHREGGYWGISNLFLNNDKMQAASILASDSFSFYCGTIDFHDTNNKKKLRWTGLQMEPYFNEKNTDELKFHDPWHCVGFTSPAIWMGIFVTFMFLFIISIGITWLMDINTMDRFDDPKGKTITINATD